MRPRNTPSGTEPEPEGSAFERAVLPHLDDAYQVARYLLHDEHDAQDAVQDAYLRALRYYDPFTVGDARAWLLTIVRRCCFASKSRRAAEAHPMTGTPELLTVPDPAPAPDAAAVAVALHEAVSAALQSLPSDQREILVLREMRQLSYREIAQVVGLPIGTVMSRLSRARRRLQAALGDSIEAAG